MEASTHQHMHHARHWHVYPLTRRTAHPALVPNVCEYAHRILLPLVGTCPGLRPCQFGILVPPRSTHLRWRVITPNTNVTWLHVHTCTCIHAINMHMHMHMHMHIHPSMHAQGHTHAHAHERAHIHTMHDQQVQFIKHSWHMKCSERSLAGHPSVHTSSGDDATPQPVSDMHGMIDLVDIY